MFLFLSRQNGLPVISLSDQKDIALEVTVRNRNGDDAHEAKLVGMFPNALSFSGFRSQKTTVSGGTLVYFSILRLAISQVTTS